MKTKLLCLLLTFSLLFFIGCDEEENETFESEVQNKNQEIVYILNINSRKIHHVYCYSASIMNSENRSNYYSYDIEPLFEEGFTCCKNCFN